MDESTNLALFSSQHHNHDSVWVVTSETKHNFLCMACMIELLQNQETSGIKRKYLLKEFVGYLSEKDAEVIDLLTLEEEVTFKIVEILFGLQDCETACDESLKALILICCRLQSDAVVYGLLQLITEQLQVDRNFTAHHSVLSLLWKLIQNIPTLSVVIIDQHGDILDNCLMNMDSTDEKLSTAIISIFTQLVIHAGEMMSSRGVVKYLIDKVFMVIGNAQGKELLTAAVALLKLLSSEPENIKNFTNLDKTAEHNMPSIIKKILLSKSDSLKISGIQSIGQVLTHLTSQEFTEHLLQRDIAEFLFEHLATTNNVLLSSILCTLLLMTECDSFFSKCHSVLGTESLLRGLDQCSKTKNTEPLQHGLHLLATILEKQPSDKKLFSGPEIFNHLTETLNSCLKHSDSHIPALATKCLTCLMRKDHIPSPINYKYLFQPIQTTMDTLGRLPRPLVRGLKRFHNQAQESQLKQGMQTKFQKQQEVVLGGVQLMETAFRLTIDLRKDPSIFEESQFAAPSVFGDESHNGDLSWFITSLMALLDQTVIPTIMANCEVLTDVKIFTAYLSMLPLPFKLNVSDEYPKKLASSCFIHWALELKSKSSLETETLHNIITIFVVELCLTLLEVSGDRSHDKELSVLSMREALECCKANCSLLTSLSEMGKEEELHHLLSQTSLQEDMMPFSSCHQGCFTILYVAYLFEDRLYPDEDVFEAVSQLLLHTSHETIKDDSLKHILFILANVSGAGSEMGRNTIIEKVMKSADLNCTEVYFTHHPAFISWCFDSWSIPIEFSKHMLHLWLRDSSSEDENNQLIFELLRTNEKCFMSALELYMSDTSGLSEVIFNLFQNLLADQENFLIHRKLITRFREKLPEICTKVTSGQGQESTLFTLLQLVNFMYKQDRDLTVDSTDLKLLHYAIGQINSFEDDTDQVLHFLNFSSCLLYLTVPQGDTRVAAVLNSSENFLKLLQRTISLTDDKYFLGKDDVVISALSLVAGLSKAVHTFKMKVDFTIHIDVQRMVQLLTKTNIGLKVSIYQMLTSVFDACFEYPLIRLKDESVPCLVSDDDAGLPIQGVNFKRIHILVQNAVLQGSDFLAWNAVSCFSSMLEYLKVKRPDLVSEFINTPWNELLITCCFELHNHQTPPGWLLLLLSLLLEYKWLQNDSTSFIGQIEGILQRTWSMEACKFDIFTISAIVNFLQQVMSLSLWKGDQRSSITQHLNEWISDVTESLSSDISKVEILEVSGALMVGDVRSLKPRDNSLHRKLMALKDYCSEP